MIAITAEEIRSSGRIADGGTIASGALIARQLTPEEIEVVRKSDWLAFGGIEYHYDRHPAVMVRRVGFGDRGFCLIPVRVTDAPDDALEGHDVDTANSPEGAREIIAEIDNLYQATVDMARELRENSPPGDEPWVGWGDGWPPLKNPHQLPVFNPYHSSSPDVPTACEPGHWAGVDLADAIWMRNR